jgi:hypothetical protein
MVIHACSPSYLGGRNGRIVVQGQPGQKVSKTLKLAMVVQMCATCLACLLWWGLTKVLPSLALNLNPPDHCFPSSWNYSHALPHPASHCLKSSLSCNNLISRKARLQNTKSMWKNQLYSHIPAMNTQETGIQKANVTSSSNKHWVYKSHKKWETYVLKTINYCWLKLKTPYISGIIYTHESEDLTLSGCQFSTNTPIDSMQSQQAFFYSWF